MFKKLRNIWAIAVISIGSLAIAPAALADIPNPDGTYNGPVRPIADTTSTYNLLAVLPMFFLLFTANIVVECLVAWGLAAVWKSLKTKPLKLVGSVAVANALSYPLFFFGLELVSKAGRTSFYLLALVIGEILVVGLEFVMIWLINRDTLSVGRALLVSIIINSVTVVLGVFLAISLGLLGLL